MTKPRRGQPPKPPEEVKSITTSIRLRPKDRAFIEKHNKTVQAFFDRHLLGDLELKSRD